MNSTGYTLNDYTVAPAPTFGLPSDNERKAVKVGDIVKLVFNFDGIGERMWVEVMDIDGEGKFSGSLANTPLYRSSLTLGSVVKFEWFHIINIEENRLEGIK